MMRRAAGEINRFPGSLLDSSRSVRSRDYGTFGAKLTLTSNLDHPLSEMTIKLNCKLTGQTFEVTEDEQNFYAEMGVGLPTLCPQERLRRRLHFRNFRSLYHRTCAATGNRIISMYSEKCPFPVFHQDYWWSDNWDPKSYGRPYDPNRSFFDQYKELSDAVPHYAVMNLNSEACEYSNMVNASRRCYLVFGCVRNEDCLYGHIVWDSSDCVDTLYAYLCQWCSNSIDIVRCYNVHYSQECTDCRESYFLYDCAGCENCFGSFNLRNAKYCVFNERLTKTEYERRMQDLLPLSAEKVAELEARFHAERTRSAITPELFCTSAENVTGNHIYESANVFDSFDVKRSEDSRHCFTVHQVSNCLDLSFNGSSARFSFDSLTLVNCERVMFSQVMNTVSDSCYSEFCSSSRDLFGCIAVKNSQYCILNRQYSADEYAALRAQIVEEMKARGEWGEFFPAWLSPFAYNEAIVNEYLPLEREEALERGYRWREEREFAAPAGVVGKVPSMVAEAGDEVVEETFYCEATNKPFRIIRAELEFHRRMGTPLPRWCPDVRHLGRMGRRARRRLVGRGCGRCGRTLATAHDQGYAGDVVCAGCYRGLLY